MLTNIHIDFNLQLLFLPVALFAPHTTGYLLYLNQSQFLLNMKRRFRLLKRLVSPFAFYGYLTSCLILKIIYYEKKNLKTLSLKIYIQLS